MIEQKLNLIFRSPLNARIVHFLWRFGRRSSLNHTHDQSCLISSRVEMSWLSWFDFCRLGKDLKTWTFSFSIFCFKLVLTFTWLDTFLKTKVFLLERSSSHGATTGQTKWGKIWTLGPAWVVLQMISAESNLMISAELKVIRWRRGTGTKVSDQLFSSYVMSPSCRYAHLFYMIGTMRNVQQTLLYSSADFCLVFMYFPNQAMQCIQNTCLPIIDNRLGKYPLIWMVFFIEAKTAKTRFWHDRERLSVRDGGDG